MAMLAPWRANGTVAGIFLGDEQCYHGVSLQNLTYITKLIRRDWPEAVLYINEAQDLLMCNFNRLNETFFPDGACWPEELDWLGFDICTLPPVKFVAALSATTTMLCADNVMSCTALLAVTVRWLFVVAVCLLTLLLLADGFDQATTFDSPRNTYEWNLFDRMSTPHQCVLLSKRHIATMRLH